MSHKKLVQIDTLLDRVGASRKKRPRNGFSGYAIPDATVDLGPIRQPLNIRPLPIKTLMGMATANLREPIPALG